MTDWPPELVLRSITTWPTTRTPEDERRSSQFRAPLRDTLRLLSRELAMIDARGVALEIAIPGDPVSNPVEWRQDGRPRAHARPSHPGVCLAFRSPVSAREIRVATDRFVSWQENLRAIAKTLEHQRAFERYGTANRGEQYAGWAQLPSGSSDPSVERGRDLIREHGGVVGALKATHPDAGGVEEDFKAVQAAREAAVA